MANDAFSKIFPIGLGLSREEDGDTIKNGIMLLFLHYKSSAEILAKLIPSGLTLDLFEGEAWISVVIFRMEKIRPLELPALSWFYNFYEINVRTYVVKDGKPGVYFLKIEAEKDLSVFVAKQLSGLPHEKAKFL